MCQGLLSWPPALEEHGGEKTGGLEYLRSEHQRHSNSSLSSPPCFMLHMWFSFLSITGWFSRTEMLNKDQWTPTQAWLLGLDVHTPQIVRTLWMGYCSYLREHTQTGYLLWGIGLDKFWINLLGFGSNFSHWLCFLEVFTGQPEFNVFLTEFWLQETPKSSQSICQNRKTKLRHQGRERQRNSHG